MSTVLFDGQYDAGGVLVPLAQLPLPVTIFGWALHRPLLDLNVGAEALGEQLQRLRVHRHVVVGQRLTGETELGDALLDLSVVDLVAAHRPVGEAELERGHPVERAAVRRSSVLVVPTWSRMNIMVASTWLRPLPVESWKCGASPCATQRMNAPA